MFVGSVRNTRMALPTSMPCKIYCDYILDGEYAAYYQNLREKCVIKTANSFRTSHEEILNDVRGATVIATCGWNKIDEEIIEAAGPRLKAICTQTTGYNHIDLAACKKRNILVGYMGDLISGSVAEYTIALMMATGRRFKEAILDLPRGGWSNWTASYLNGFQVMNSTVGVIGLGNIETGLGIVKRLQAFGVKKTLYCGPKRKPEGDALGAHYTTFEDLLRESDFVVVACILNDQTRGLFNQAAFNLMKPTSIFINVSRGAVVDQDALYEALTTNKIFAAGLDVITPEPAPPDHPLIGLENCVVMSHMGTDVVALRRKMTEANVANIQAVINSKPIPLELLL